jgi:hypothetical protein
VILYWNHYLQGEDGNQKIAKRAIEKPHKVSRGAEVVSKKNN